MPFDLINSVPVSTLTERPSGDCPAVNCPASDIVDLLTKLRDDFGFSMLMDVTAIDNGLEASPRFTVVYHLMKLETRDYVRVAADCEDDDEPSMPSACDIWPAANWHERETYDMFGITFDGHPDLRRILMWDGYPYYPLRKEFPLAGHEVELPAADVAEVTGASVLPAPMMGGPFVASQKGRMSDREPRAKDESWTETRKKFSTDDADD